MYNSVGTQAMIFYIIPTISFHGVYNIKAHTISRLVIVMSSGKSIGLTKTLTYKYNYSHRKLPYKIYIVDREILFPFTTIIF